MHISDTVDEDDAFQRTRDPVTNDQSDRLPLGTPDQCG